MERADAHSIGLFATPRLRWSLHPSLRVKIGRRDAFLANFGFQHVGVAADGFAWHCSVFSGHAWFGRTGLIARR